MWMLVVAPMPITGDAAFRLASAIAIGLLIGAERERRKSSRSFVTSAGIRTFALASLAGGLSLILGGELLLTIVVASVAVLTAVGYVRTRDQDPGLTTETALILVVLLGALAQRDVRFASGVAVVVTILLAARERLHRFVSSVLSEEELTDALILAAATLVVLPLMPNRYLGPYAAINPRTIWKIVVLMMSISGLGYVAVRLVGVRFGLPISGLASGFVSSTATIASMGERARATPALMRSAVAAAVLSTVATVLQMAAVIAATNEATLRVLRIPLLASGLVAIAYGVVLTMLSLRQKTTETTVAGRAFSLRTALFFSGLIAVVLLVSAALRTWIGTTGVLITAAVAGFADTHSAAVSVASLVASNKLTPTDAVIPILTAMTTNTFSKAVFAFTSGGRPYALRVFPGLVLVMAAAWLGAAFILRP
jgi:uncharacterized membrane protein (DUF4010 family)